MAAALEIPTGERRAFLDVACGADEELRREVESLLGVAETGGVLPAARDAAAATRMTFAMDADSSLGAAIEQTLGERYEFLRLLGSGGMGAVFLARERTLDRLVAVKVLRPDLAEGVEGRERFRREARIAAQLAHPGILPLYAYGESGGIWYFVMGYVRGQSLADRLRLEGRLEPDEARRILIEIAYALDCAHRHGVVHRDIKPSNVLLDEESGRTLLADFGISKLTAAGDTLTTTGLVVGSPHFMSPEQALASQDVDERSDIYSLGAVGYTMLAGREPFVGASASELIYRRVATDPPALLSLAPDVPPDLASCVMRCLARDPALRWASARELKDAVGRTAEGVARASLPEAVRDLPSFGAYALVWAIGWSALALAVVQTPRARALLLLVAALVPLGLVVHVWHMGSTGLRPMQLVRIAAWPPEWWGMWWPRALRRPDDLWGRLPWPLRFVRIAMTVFFLALPVFVFATEWLSARGEASSGATEILLIGEVALVLGTALILVAGMWWATRRGLSVPERVRVLFGPTAPGTFWNTPHVARLLYPPAGGVRPPNRNDASDHRRAIGEMGRLLGPRASGAVHEALRAAERLTLEIERCELELQSLSRDAGPGEVDRLTAQLVTLEAPGAEDSHERRELRTLIAHQLELVRRIRARHDRISERSGNLLHLLRGLWSQLCLLQDAGGAGAHEPDGTNGGLRALCAEIDGATRSAGDAGAPREPG